MEMYENKREKEKALLVSVDTGEFDAEVSIDELEELAHTAGAEVLGKLIQKRERPEAATFVGAGKLAEIIAFCSAQDVDLLIFDSELTPSQQRNLEKLTGVRVIDRTMLILDIFAARARTGEGKLQVELASLNIPCRALPVRVSRCRVLAAESEQEVRAKASLKATADTSTGAFRSLKNSFVNLKSAAIF